MESIPDLLIWESFPGNSGIIFFIIIIIPQHTHKFWPQSNKSNFMFNSAEHEIFVLINIKMPTAVGILTFMSMKNSILCLSQPEKTLNFLIGL